MFGYFKRRKEARIRQARALREAQEAHYAARQTLNSQHTRNRFAATPSRDNSADDIVLAAIALDHTTSLTEAAAAHCPAPEPSFGGFSGGGSSFDGGGSSGSWGDSGGSSYSSSSDSGSSSSDSGGSCGGGD